MQVFFNSRRIILNKISLHEFLKVSLMTNDAKFIQSVGSENRRETTTLNSEVSSAHFIYFNITGRKVYSHAQDPLAKRLTVRARSHTGVGPKSHQRPQTFGPPAPGPVGPCVNASPVTVTVMLGKYFSASPCWGGVIHKFHRCHLCLSLAPHQLQDRLRPHLRYRRLHHPSARTYLCSFVTINKCYDIPQFIVLGVFFVFVKYKLHLRYTTAQKIVNAHYFYWLYCV